MFVLFSSPPSLSSFLLPFPFPPLSLAFLPLPSIPLSLTYLFPSLPSSLFPFLSLSHYAPG